MEFLLKRFTPIIFFFFLANCSNTIFHLSRGEEDSEQFGECSRPYKCGDIKSLPLPFWGGDNPPDHCGHPEFKVSCKENNSVFKINDVEYRILNLSYYNQTNKIRITRLDLSEDPCSPHRPYVNSTLSNRYGLNLYFPPTFENLTLFYGCRSFNTTTVLYTIDSLLESLQPNRLPLSCQGIVQVPILRNAFGESPSSGKQLGMDKVREVLSEGFEVHYPEFEGCRACRPSYSNIYGWKLGVIIGATTGGIAILLISITVWFCKITTLAVRTTSVWKSTRSFFKNTTLAVRTTSVWKNIIKGDQDQDIEAFIRSYGHLTVKRYRFSDIKKMTESFKDKLGKGGYGEVYRGKLLDERLVAVKLLKSTKGNGQEFINEVVSISRTSHVNIVSLLGFCLEDGKRALIYEFMPNGSLEKFIYNDCQLQSIPQLAWEKLLQIAIGIARGLEYLHRGCNTRILHFDIKPHNILLDEDLCPKIADFGLAKLCPKKESIVSLLDARGTIGYIAPEVFNRKFGGVSSKSDVYSYGMMILEMAGGRKNIKVETGHTSEIYFPDWIYKRLQQGSNLELWGEITSEENEIAKKMVIVGLWCIQTMPSDRPSMSKVIEMLEGSLEALHVPQKPSLFAPSSPERLATELAAESSTT